jgi:flagellar basal-body rod protein FlgF
MENTLLVGLSRQVALERQLDVIANNIANVNTTGFKAENSMFEEFLRTPASEGNFVGADQRVSFVQDRATWHDFTQGATQETGNPLDVVIDGDGFLAVQTQAGERYTRNGAMQINGQGQLVTMDGNPVLGTGGPITLQPGDTDVTVSADGTVTVREVGNPQGNAIRGKIRVVSFDSAQQLVKSGSNLFAAPAGVVGQPKPTNRLIQGAVEKSNVSSVAEMTRMLEVTRTYTNIASILQQQNDLQKTAIDRLAEIPA